MKKNDLIRQIARDYKIPINKATDIITDIFNTISNVLIKTYHVELRSFGIFKLKVQQAKVGRNPKNPSESIIIPRRIVVKFKPGARLQKKIDSLGK